MKSVNESAVELRTLTALVEVQGTTLKAKVTIEIDGLLPEHEFVDHKMILRSLANGQNMSVASRHHPDRAVKIMVNEEAPVVVKAAPRLRRVA